MTTNEMYQQLGISPEVLDFGQRVLDGLDEENVPCGRHCRV